MRLPLDRYLQPLARGSVEHLPHLACDLQVFTRRDDERAHAGIGAANLSVSGILVARRVHLHAEELKAVQRSVA